MSFKSPEQRRAAFAKGRVTAWPRGKVSNVAWERTVRAQAGRVKGWTVPISPATHGALARQLLRQRFPEKKRGEHEADANRFEAAQKKLEAAWAKHWDEAFQRTHGRKPTITDYRVSGIGDDRLAESDKEVLRGLAAARSRAINLAAAHRAAGKHLRRRA